MFPLVTREQMTWLDFLLVEKYHKSILGLMDIAGARLAQCVSDNNPAKKRIAIFCGKGNNGGDGLAASTYLKESGYDVLLFLAHENLKNEPLHYLERAKKQGVRMTKNMREAIDFGDVLIDCLLGYKCKGEPRAPFDELIRRMNDSRKPIIACDVPSGLDSNTGPAKTCIMAQIVLCMALPRIGLENYVAKIFIADIGVPKNAYADIGLEAKDYFKGEKLSLL